MTSLNLTTRMAITWFLAFMLVAGLGGTASGAAASDTAIKGYDPVAYFVAGKAMKGSESFTYQWHDLTWHFQSSEHRDMFAAAPEKFAPRYDGYCAWAMTEKRKAITDPEVWKIVDGKLYLNCSLAAYEKWRRDIPGNIAKADANWLEFQQGR